jgi:hypothetical protein
MTTRTAAARALTLALAFATLATLSPRPARAGKIASDQADAIEAYPRDVHVIVGSMGDVLTLVGVLYGTEPFVIGVCSDRQLWHAKIRDGGLAWVIAPGLRRFTGPSSVPEMLIDVESDTPTGPLAALHAALLSVPDPPPLHLVPAPARARGPSDHDSPEWLGSVVPRAWR